MTSFEAVYSFLTGIFGRAAPSGSVYSGSAAPELPYVVYSAPLGPVFGQRADGFVDLYYIDRDSSGAEAAQALEEFSRAVGLGGLTLDFDGGRLYITRGEPFYKLSADKADQSLKCVRLKLGFCFIDPERSISVSDGEAGFSIDSRSEITVASRLVGARAESVTGKTVMDCLGTKTAVNVKTCWLEKQTASEIIRLIAAKPLLFLTLSDPFASSDGSPRTAEFMFEMPKVIAEAEEPEQDGGEFVRLEINALEQGIN